MIWLLRFLRDHGDAVEADLSRWHHIDLRDRDRFEHGRRCLTARMIAVRLRHLPAESATVQIITDGRPPWTLDQVLLSDIWQATQQSKKARQHPLRVEARQNARTHRTHTPDRRRKLAAARRRARERREALTEEV